MPMLDAYIPERVPCRPAPSANCWPRSAICCSSTRESTPATRGPLAWVFVHRPQAYVAGLPRDVIDRCGVNSVAGLATTCSSFAGLETLDFSETWAGGASFARRGQPVKRVLSSLVNDKSVSGYYKTQALVFRSGLLTAGIEPKKSPQITRSDTLQGDDRLRLLAPRND